MCDELAAKSKEQVWAQFVHPIYFVPNYLLTQIYRATEDKQNERFNKLVRQKIDLNPMDSLKNAAEKLNDEFTPMQKELEEFRFDQALTEGPWKQRLGHLWSLAKQSYKR